MAAAGLDHFVGVSTEQPLGLRPVLRLSAKHGQTISLKMRISNACRLALFERLTVRNVHQNRVPREMSDGFYGPMTLRDRAALVNPRVAGSEFF